MIDNINDEPWTAGKLVPSQGIQDQERENRQRVLDNMKKVKAEIDALVDLRKEVLELGRAGRVDLYSSRNPEGDSEAFYAYTGQTLHNLRGTLADMVRSFKDLV